MLVCLAARRGDRRCRAAIGHRIFEGREIIRPAADHLGDALGPDLGVGPDVVDDEASEPLGVFGGVGHRDDPAHRGADQHEIVEPKLSGEPREIFRLIFIAIGAGR